MKKNHKPIRMCIVCKKRYEKQELKRFWVNEGRIYTKFDCKRSFYLCECCLNAKEKALQKAFLRACGVNINKEFLKELIDG